MKKPLKERKLSPQVLKKLLSRLHQKLQAANVNTPSVAQIEQPDLLNNYNQNAPCQ